MEKAIKIQIFLAYLFWTQPKVGLRNSRSLNIDFQPWHLEKDHSVKNFRFLEMLGDEIKNYCRSANPTFSIYIQAEAEPEYKNFSSFHTPNFSTFFNFTFFNFKISPNLMNIFSQILDFSLHSLFIQFLFTQYLFLHKLLIISLRILTSSFLPSQRANFQKTIQTDN